MQNQKISLPDPCPMFWGRMKKAPGGRHCGSCNKVVRDFTNSSVDEIQEAFRTHGLNLCGRFRENQLIDNPLRAKSLLYQSRFFFLSLIALVGFNVNPLVAQTNSLKTKEPQKVENESKIAADIEKRTSKKHKRGIWPFRRKYRKGKIRIGYF